MAAEYGAPMMSEEQVEVVMHALDVCRSSTQFLEIRADQNWGAAEDRLRWVRKSLESWRLLGDAKEERALWGYQLEGQVRKEKVFYMRSLLGAGVQESELRGAWGELLKEAVQQSRISLETELFHKRREYLKGDGESSSKVKLQLREVLEGARVAKERLELNLGCPFIKSELEDADVEIEPKSFFVKEVNASIRAQTMEMKMMLEVQKVRLTEVLGGRLEELVEVESKRQKVEAAKGKDEKVQQNGEAEMVICMRPFWGPAGPKNKGVWGPAGPQKALTRLRSRGEDAESSLSSLQVSEAPEFLRELLVQL